MIVVSQPATALRAMDDWNTRTHTKSGLVDRVLESDIFEDEAADMTLAFLSNGSSGAIADVRQFHLPGPSFMARHMPLLERFSTTATWMSVL